MTRPGVIAIAFVVFGVISIAGRPSISAQAPAQATKAAQRPAASENGDDFDVNDFVRAAKQSNLEEFDVELMIRMMKFGGTGLPPSSGPQGGDDQTTQDEDVIPIHGDSSGKVDEILAPEDDEGPAFSGPSAEPLEGLARFNRTFGARVAPLASPAAVVTRLPDGTMEMRVYSPNGLTAEQRSTLLAARGVLVPLSTSARHSIVEWIASVASRGSGVHLTRVPLRGYCVESKKQAPASGAMYIWGPAAVQEQFAPMRVVRAVSEVASSGGFLKPQGDAAEYGRFITQYAIWTKLEHWDQARFTDEFIRRSKQASQTEHRQWTPDTERTFRALAPGRWHDIQLVMRASDGVEKRLRESNGGAR